MTSDDYVLAKKRLEELLELDSYRRKEPIVIYEVIYCLLMKIFLIKHASKKSFDSKVEMLIDFINTELYCYMESELVLCILYLKNDISTNHFFRTIQPNSKKIFKNLGGTAWDLLHIRNTVNEMAIRIKEEEMLCLHLFASRDLGLLSVIEFNPIKRVVFYDGKPYIRFEKTIRNIGLNPEIEDKIRRGIDVRYAVSKKTNYSRLVFKLEKEIENLVL